MPSTRVTAAHARDAKQRHADYSNPLRITCVAASLNNVARSGLYNAPRFERSLQEGGLKTDHDCTLRLLKSVWPEFTSALQFEKAKIELWLNGAWVALHTGPATDLHVSGEWKLGLESFVA